MTPRDAVMALRQGWWFIVASILVAVIAAAAASNAITPRYSASTEVFVGASGAADPGQLGQLSLFALDRMESYAELSRSPLVLEPVVEELNLPVSSNQLADQIVVSTSADTVLMTVTVTYADAATAAAIADSIVDRLAVVVTEVEPDAAGASPTISLTTTRRAVIPDQPSSPSWVLNLALATLLGAVTGGGISLLRFTTRRPPSKPFRSD